MCALLCYCNLATFHIWVRTEFANALDFRDLNLEFVVLPVDPVAFSSSRWCFLPSRCCPILSGHPCLPESLSTGFVPGWAHRLTELLEPLGNKAGKERWLCGQSFSVLLSALHLSLSLAKSGPHSLQQCLCYLDGNPRDCRSAATLWVAVWRELSLLLAAPPPARTVLCSSAARHSVPA